VLAKSADGDWEDATVEAVKKGVEDFASDFGYDLDEDGLPTDDADDVEKKSGDKSDDDAKDSSNGASAASDDDSDAASEKADAEKADDDASAKASDDSSDEDEAKSEAAPA